MARFYALVANGGKLVTPHLAEDVEQSGSDGQPLRVLRRFGAQPPQPVNVDPTALNYVRLGLEEATHASIGTSSGVFGNFKVDIAGKTGSAEEFVHVKGLPNALKLNQSWWCGYGPFDAPTIVVCAVIENGGHGGAAAAPAALQGVRAVLPHDRDDDREAVGLDGHRSRRSESTWPSAAPRGAGGRVSPRWSGGSTGC